MKLKISPNAMFPWIAAGLLCCGHAQAQIALQDGSLNSLAIVTNRGSYTVSTNFTVTAGASVMVVSLWDRNTESNHSSPSFGTWSNTTAGTVQNLTRAVSVNPNSATYSDSDIYYLYNPNAGTGTITLIDTNGTNRRVTVQGMIIQLYDLSGVNTSAPPAVYATNSPTGAGTSLSVTSAASTLAGSWAAMIGYDANGAYSLGISASSGSSYYVDLNTYQQQAMGYATNLAVGSTTFTLTEGSGGGPTNIDMAVAIFAAAGAGPTNTVTPQFSNLNNQTLTYGTANVLLTGTVATSSNSPPNGTPVSASVDGVTQSGGVYDTTGDFSISYDAVGIPASGTPYTVTYTSAAEPGFNGATNTSTTMTVNPLPVVVDGYVTFSPSNTTTVPASDLFVANLVGNDYVTLSGSVAIASTNLGAEAITSFSGLTLGGTAAANYTLTGATGTVAITSPITQTNFGITEIRTASPTELVAFYVFTNVTGPVYGMVYPTNLVTTSQPSKWTLNGTPVKAISGEFVTEANAVEYHIYLQVPELLNGASYTLVTPYSTNSFVFQDSDILCESIKVNQDAYSALSTERFADFAIWLGTGGSQPISGPLPNYTVINAFTGQQVASGTLTAFNSGIVDTSSGDYVYRIDLSGVPAGGPYRVVVSGYGCSYPFGVGGNFSQRLAYVAFRALYYQRCGCPIVQPYAYANIRPTPCHTNIYDNESPDDPSSSSINVTTTTYPLLVVGGYHDAGDAQKNPYALETPMVLMTTYEAFPGAFTTNEFNIPATFDANYNITGGYNGIPDILNEINWGLKLYTNLQSTTQEPLGSVCFGTASDNEPNWGINFDQDTMVYSTETNNGWCCSMAAGAFMNYARLIQPYNPALAMIYSNDAVAAYAAAGSSATFQQQLCYNIQKFLMDGDTTASNNIEGLYTQASGITTTWDDEASGFAVNNGQIWMASDFMSYVLTTNRARDPKVVTYFTNAIITAANNQIGYLSGDAYPFGWPTNQNPYTQNNFAHGPYASQGEFAYPCLMAWLLTGQQQYINAVSVLMDYDHGLNPLGKDYMSGMGFNRTHNPHMIESAYAEFTAGLGGPEPGITVYGPGENNNAVPEQIPPALPLPPQREWVDDLGNYQWSEFTDYQSEAWPAAIYTVLAQGVTWRPAQGEPFLYHGAAITPNGNGSYSIQFGGLPYQTYYLQAATSLNGPWTTVSGPVTAGVTGMVQFTHNPNSAQTFYRTSGQTQLY
ncbi:MAG: glycoside hydrolase family 9 protein [Verrucomicrobiota bacterium]|jgi:endoglucanase